MDYSDELLEPIVTDDLSTKHLTFLIDGQYYGIPISNVIEIIQAQRPTKLPELPLYAKGVINLRGQVVPLIDVNLRFGKQEKEYTDNTCIIIMDISGTYAGFIVDSVEEVLNIEPELISEPPKLPNSEPANYVVGIAKMEKCIVLLLDICLLIPDVQSLM